VTSSFTSPAGLTALTATYTGASYPVYVDYFGTKTMGTPLGQIPRVAPSYTTQTGMTVADGLRWFTILDDITFGTNGLPSASTIVREPRYSWAYMLQRPAANNASVANLTVVVYNGRPLGSASIETALGGPQAAAAAGQKFITFSGTPSITRGSWLLDANVSTEKQPDPHGFFYRVVDISNP